MSVKGFESMKERVFFEEFDSIYYYHGSTQNWSMKGFHFHKQYEIILFLNDGATLEVENCVYPVQKGDLFLINNKEYHRTCGVEGKDYARYVLMFDPEMLSSMKDAFQYDFKEFFEQRRENFMHKLSLEGENLAKIERLFLEVEQYAGEKNDPVAKVNLKLTILRLLISVNEMYHFLVYDGNENVLLEQESVDFESPVLYRERIEQIKKYICIHAEDKLDLDHIAQKFYMNRYYLSHYFKKETGFTILQYITNQKMMLAKTLLRDGVSITEAAIRLSYSSDSHFISVFKKNVGITPKKYAQSKKQ